MSNARTGQGERRRYPRSRRQLSVVTDTGGPGVLNHVDNISANGVLCHTVKPIPLMTRMQISLDIPKPHEQRVDAEGIVVRCDLDEQGDDNFKVAILFTKISDQDHEAIRRFVDHDLAETVINE
ncbi:MAG: PilZ domain-containing protein [Candidatus Hydrogenedentes bacterium]|nr:PilZ domain-containing protein [Candidatus Hydrogenedentota bacterium]